MPENDLRRADVIHHLLSEIPEHQVASRKPTLIVENCVYIRTTHCYFWILVLSLPLSYYQQQHPRCPPHRSERQPSPWSNRALPCLRSRTNSSIQPTSLRSSSSSEETSFRPLSLRTLGSGLASCLCGVHQRSRTGNRMILGLDGDGPSGFHPPYSASPRSSSPLDGSRMPLQHWPRLLEERR